jgi:hypothetical protein
LVHSKKLENRGLEILSSGFENSSNPKKLTEAQVADVEN